MLERQLTEQLGVFKMDRNLETCIDLIRKSKNMVVLSGAGISTESGIKDFRSKIGVYKRAPEYILSLNYFYQQPKKFYQFVMEHL
jgi:NAD-dependent deacetylase